MVNAAELLISADSHVIEDPQLWVKNLPRSLRDRAPSYPELKMGNEFQACEGGWNPASRIEEMAMDNVSGEVLYPSLALDQFGIRDADLQEACFRVYNDWLSNYCSHAPDQLFGVASISVYRLDNAVKEMERCKKEGFRGVQIWEVPPDNLPFTSDHYTRFWAAAQDLELPVSLHIAAGAPYEHGVGEFRPDKFTSLAEVFHFSVNSKLNYAVNALGDIIAAGVLERFPGLRIVLVENEVSWLPFVISRWDRYVGKHKNRVDTPLKMLPSEYFRRQIYVTFFNDPPLRWLFPNWGIENCMWSNDFPHPNTMWPNSIKGIERDLGHLPAAIRAKVLRENVSQLYGLSTIKAVAA